MDVWTIIGGLGIVVGIVAGVVQIVEYVQGRREKPVPLAVPDATPADHATEQPPFTLLRQILTERFDAGELRTLQQL